MYILESFVIKFPYLLRGLVSVQRMRIALAGVRSLRAAGAVWPCPHSQRADVEVFHVGTRVPRHTRGHGGYKRRELHRLGAFEV